MTKELKFRAKIKENGKPKMFYQEEQYLVSFLRRVTMFLAFEHDDKDADGFNGGRHESYLEDHALEKCLEQFTGLKDKNGVLIYEGDIIEAREAMFGEGANLKNKNVVKFEDGAFKVATVNLFIVTENVPSGLSFDAEVIGNIYENPELLK